jgi:hypothetical protein
MKQLKFSHITKTAGTTIEDEAKECNILWGRHHKEYGFWHETLSNKHLTLIEKYDWFTVVRNPYTRIISEFHCKCSDGSQYAKKIRDKFTKEEFNNYLIGRIIHYNQIGNHYTPQYYYTDNEIPISVLRFENLNSEFNMLMKKYKLPVVINSHKNKTSKIFNSSDINQKLRDIINKTYEKDFEYFNYDIELK